jgi:hypothetical protein
LLKEIEDDLAGAGLQNWRLFTISPIGRAPGNHLQISHYQFIHLLDFMRTIGKDTHSRELHIVVSHTSIYEGVARDGSLLPAGIHIASDFFRWGSPPVQN